MRKIALAGCIILDREKNILLIHRNTVKRSQWEIPGGKVEQGESISAAAEREIREELGVTINSIVKLGIKEFIEDEKHYGYNWFQAIVVQGEPHIVETDKFDQLRYFGFNELMGMLDVLSPNTQNFLNEYKLGRVRLQTSVAFG